jgi:hypothetical protein
MRADGEELPCMIAKSRSRFADKMMGIRSQRRTPGLEG